MAGRSISQSPKPTACYGRESVSRSVACPIDAGVLAGGSLAGKLRSVKPRCMR